MRWALLLAIAACRVDDAAPPPSTKVTAAAPVARASVPAPAPAQPVPAFALPPSAAFVEEMRHYCNPDKVKPPESTDASSFKVVLSGVLHKDAAAIAFLAAAIDAAGGTGQCPKYERFLERARKESSL